MLAGLRVVIYGMQLFRNGSGREIARKIVKIVILLKNPPFILREPQDERRSG
jgi:hypothetical protein